MNWTAIRTLVLLAPWAGFAIHAPAQAAPLSAPQAQAVAPPLSAEPKAQPPVNSDMDGRLMYELLLAEISVQENAASRGYAIMLDAARRTGDIRLYQRAADIALQSRSGDAAMQAIEAWRRAEPKSREANRYLLQTLLALNRTSETTGPLRRELEATPLPEQPIAILAIPQLYQRVSERALAAQTVEAALRPLLNTASPAVASAAWVTVGRMKLQADDAAGAMQAARQAQQAQPQTEGAALLALQLTATDQREAAVELLQQYLAQPNPRPEIRLDYARVLLQDGQADTAREQLQQVTQVTPTPDAALGLDGPSPAGEAWLLLGLLDLEQDRLQAAQDELTRYLALSQDETEGERRTSNRSQAYLALSQVAERRGDPVAASDWLKHITAPQAAADVLLRRADILARQGQLDEALALLRDSSLPEATPGAADRVKALGAVRLLRDNGRPVEAYSRLNAYNKAQAQAGTPDSDLLYDQAMLADEIKRDRDVEPLLREVIRLAPENAHAYNALGYFLADRNQRLDEARSLIDKALQLAPDDPFITDSLGWVAYRAGNLDEAIRLLRRANTLRPDAEIATHLGEVLWQDGQHDAARAAWRQARALNPNHPALDKTLQRLGVGAL